MNCTAKLLTSGATCMLTAVAGTPNYSRCPVAFG